MTHHPDPQDPTGTAMAMAAGKHIGPEGGSIARDFRDFDDANPQVYAELVRLARLWREKRGAERLGVATLYEVTRWMLALRVDQLDSFKLNNNHRALYARKIMHHEPDLASMFETRKVSAKCRCSGCADG